MPSLDQDNNEPEVLQAPLPEPQALPVIAGANFFLSYWKELLGLTLVVGMGLTIFTQNLRIKHLSATNTELQADIKLQEVELGNCRDNYNDLNDEIARLSSETESYNKQMKELEALLNKMRRDNKTKVDNILNKPTPESCDAAIQFLRENLEVFGK